MKDKDKTKEQLLSESEDMRQRVAELEAAEAERKWMEEELRKTRDYLDSLIQYANAPIIVWDTEQRITTFNTAFERMTGHMAGEVMGQPLTMLFPEASRRKSLAKIRQTLSGEYWESVEIPILRKDGGIRIVFWNSANIYDKDDKTLLATIAQGQDITERKKAEERTERLNLVLRTIRNVNQLIIREKDRDKLLKGSCDNLTGTRGYYHAWIALLDESGKLVAHAESGLGKSFLPIVERLKRGQLPACMQRALKQSEAVVTEDPVSTCTDCPLSSDYAGRGAATARLEYGGKVYGILTVSVLGEMATDVEELGLFHEVVTDITFVLHNIELEEQRKQAEGKLADEAIRRRILVEQSRDGIVVLDQNGKVFEANQRFSQMLGYSPEEIIKLHVWDWDTQWAKEQLLEMLQSVDATGDHFETYHRRKDGTIYDVGVSTNGAIIAGQKLVFCVCRDITDRKQAEEQIRQFQGYLQLQVERMPIGLIVWDVEFRVQSWNPAAEKTFGFTAGEALGKHSYDFIVPKEAKPQVDDIWRRLLKGDTTAHSINENVTKDGRTIICEWSNTPLKKADGTVAGVLSMVQDITERKQAEEKLHVAEQNFRNSLDSSPLGIRIVTAEGELLYANQVTLDIYGYSSIEELKTTPTKQRYTPESYAEHCKRVEDRKQDKSAPSDYEISIVRKDGEIRHLTVSRKKVVWGGEVQYQVIYQDITERKQAEEERMKIEKLESVGTLAGGIAHDFNNILTGIMGNISLAMRYVEPKSKAEERLLEAEKASERAKDLTQQLLTFSRGGAPVKKPVSIAGLLKESTGFALRGSNIRCDFDLPEDLWPVEADEGQLNQVITNLVINAQEAMPEGGVININASNITVQDKSTLPLSKGIYVKIDIIDHGVGIKKKHLDRIFDPYFTTKQKGSGLGLATSYSIIKNHSGHITVESKVETGTTFHMYLPASKKRVPKGKEAEAVQPALFGKGRILVMDDEEMIRKLLSRMLSLAGYEVTPTEDGAEAIEQYTKARESGKPFGAVIMDLTIPGGMGGKEAIKKLLEIDPGAKVIVSSGYATDPMMADYEKYGFSAVVTKPYSAAQIEKTLHNLLGKKK